MCAGSNTPSSSAWSWRWPGRSASTWPASSRGNPPSSDRLLRPVEALLYRLLGVRPEREMTPAVYLLSFLAFSALGTVLLFAAAARSSSGCPAGPTSVT